MFPERSSDKEQKHRPEYSKSLRQKLIGTYLHALIPGPVSDFHEDRAGYFIELRMLLLWFRRCRLLQLAVCRSRHKGQQEYDYRPFHGGSI